MRDDDAFLVIARPVSAHGAVAPAPARVAVATEDRAKAIVAAVPTHRSYRRVPLSELTEVERAGILRARAQATAANV